MVNSGEKRTNYIWRKKGMVIKMNRRIFAEKNYNITGKVVPYDKFRLFIDKQQGFTINPEHFPKIIERAEALLNKEYPQLIASDYMMFKRDGNRSIYEGKYFPRRGDILTLALAEYVEKKGRFTDKIIDVLWLILEETSWVIPAHNPSKPGVNCCLPYAYTGKVDYIDLFAATTGATLAWIYYLCKDEFDNVTGLINERLLFELNRRIVQPYLDPVACGDKMWWTGVRGNTVNNWCPWIVSNILTVCALTVKDLPTREAIVRNALPMLDNFTSVYHDDGGCDEGPSYWNAAGGALFNACEVLYDLTNGYVNVFEDDLMRKMGEYEVKVVVNGNRLLNFADSPAKVNPSPIMLYQWGVLSKSEMMRTYGQNKLNGGLTGVGIDSSMPYRSFKFLVEPRLPKCDFVAPTKFWLDGIIIAGTRETSATDKGLYLAFKGGNNAESHNHNDIGTLVVFADGKPIFLDAGSGRYTRRTFSGERYTIWAMRSDYHNVATINGVVQKGGRQEYSCDHVYDETTGKLTMNLKNAYPKEAGIEAYSRSAVLENSVITITDNITLEKDGDIMFSYICDEKPTEVNNDSFVLHGRTVTFDPELEYAVEELDKTWPEVAGIPGNWDVDVLYRVTLKNKSPIKSKTYVMTVR